MHLIPLQTFDFLVLILECHSRKVYAIPGFLVDGYLEVFYMVMCNSSAEILSFHRLNVSVKQLARSNEFGLIIAIPVLLTTHTASDDLGKLFCRELTQPLH